MQPASGEAPRGRAVIHALATSLQNFRCSYIMVPEQERGERIMRFLLKVLAAPIVAALTVFVWLCVGVLYCISMVTGLAGWVIGFLGVVVLFTTSVQNGVILLVIAFLLSPLGLPSAALWMLGKVQDLRYFIQDSVY